MGTSWLLFVRNSSSKLTGDWSKCERSRELTPANRGVETSEDIYYIYLYIYTLHTHMYVCLPHILDVARGRWCGNFINRLQQIVKNLWTRFAAKKLSEILAKKKVDCSSLFRVRSGVFLLVCLLTAWKMQTNEKCSNRKWGEWQKELQGHEPKGVGGLAKVASSNGNWSNWNALLMATKIVNLWTSRGNWTKWFKTFRVSWVWGIRYLGRL